MDTNTVTVVDPRTGDRIVVEITHALEFVQATRYAAHLGKDPLVYDRWEEIPWPLQQVIEERICG